jgi:hypothetical protein
MTIPALPLFKHRDTVVTPADQNQFVTQFENTMDTMSNDVIPAMNNAITDVNGKVITATTARNEAVSARDIAVAAKDEALTAVATLQEGAIDDTTIAPNKAFSNQYTNNNFVNLTGNQTIGGYKTFSFPIRGSLIGTVAFAGSTGNDYANSNIEIRGNGSTIKPGIGFHQLGLFAGTLEMLDGNTFQFKTQAGQLATVAKSPNDSGVKTALNASGTAPIYACRAWVNFNGTGTVAIRASGNVSSIIDNGVGKYTVNFLTNMQDANYCVDGSAIGTTNGNAFFVSGDNTRPSTTSSFSVIIYDANVNITDVTHINISSVR